MEEPMIMFHNGSMKDNLNFKTICPFKQKEQSTIITYDNSWGGVYIYRTGELMMEDYSSINEALLSVDRHSYICSYWEIYKLLFILHNVNPKWLEVNITTDNENYDKVFFV